MNRLNAISGSNDRNQISQVLVENLLKMLDEKNILVKNFRMTKERLGDGSIKEMRVRLLCIRQSNGREYNLLTCSEVAILIIGDFDGNNG